MFRIYLDSNHPNSLQNSGDSNPADTTFLLGDIIPDEVTNVAIYLESASIPIIEHCFQTGINDQLKFYENSNNAVEFTATIPKGTYTGTEFATVLQTAMNAAGAANTYTAQYNTTSKLLSVFTTIPDTYRIDSASTCLQKIGFVASSTFSVTKTSSYIVDLTATRHIDITSSIATGSVALNSRPNILARIPITESFGAVQYYEVQNPVPTIINSNALRQVEIRLFNDDGRLYSIDPTHRITYTLAVRPMD